MNIKRDSLKLLRKSPSLIRYEQRELIEVSPGVWDESQLPQVHESQGLETVGLYPVDKGGLVEAVQRPVERVHGDHGVVRHDFAPEEENSNIINIK